MITEILPANSVVDSGFNVDNSARFTKASSDYLNRTHGASGSTRKMTISFWIKKCVSKDHGQADGMMILGGQQDSYPGFHLTFLSSTDTLIFRDARAANQVKFDVRSDAKFRDLSAWSHIVYALDTTQGTASNRIKLYINGTQTLDLNGVGATGGGSDSPLYPDENLDTIFNGNEAHFINKYASNYEDFYLSEYCFIDGTQLGPTSFGEFDSDSGIWKPIDVSDLTFGTNGFYLDFKDSSALGNDANGSNNWTSNNFAAINQTTDTCTNNFATLNRLNSTLTNTVLSEGNLKLVGGRQSAQYTYITGTIAVSSGKWYWEVKAVDNSEIDQVGVAKMDLAQFATISTSTGLQGAAYGGRGVQMSNGNKVGDGSQGAHMGGFSANNICMIALDLDNNKITFGRNGSWSNGSGGADQTFANATAAYTDLTAGAMYVPAQTMRDSGNNNPGTMEYNFGNAPYAISSGNSDGNGHGNFEYAVPSGYFALNTKNLAEHG